MSELAIAEVEVPQVKRRSSVPFLYEDQVKRLAENKRTKDSAGLAFKFAVPEGTEINSVIYQWRRTAANLGVSLRTQVDEEARTVTIWAADRKTVEQVAAEKAEKAAKKVAKESGAAS